MEEFKADLHCHTTCSDGSMTPKELLMHAKEIGLSGISITDHDTIQAYDEAITLANDLGLEIISGAEFSSHYNDEPVHILAYGFPLNNPIIKAFCDRHTDRRIHRNRAILEKLAKHGMKIQEKELIINPNEKSDSIGRPHIAQAMVKKQYVGSIKEAFNKYIGEGCSCYEQGERFSVEETLQQIHDAGGLAVMAHPHLMSNIAIVEEIIPFGFDGLEVYYARFSYEKNQKWEELAKRYNLLATGGSDFHGSVKPTIPLGVSWAPLESFRILQKHFKSHDLS